MFGAQGIWYQRRSVDSWPTQRTTEQGGKDRVRQRRAYKKNSALINLNSFYKFRLDTFSYIWLIYEILRSDYWLNKEYKIHSAILIVVCFQFFVLGQDMVSWCSIWSEPLAVASKLQGQPLDLLVEALTDRMITKYSDTGKKRVKLLIILTCRSRSDQRWPLILSVLIWCGLLCSDHYPLEEHIVLIWTSTQPLWSLTARWPAPAL